ncbi:hypothetical protein C1H46_006674 [Malus baccata]|uniref:Uncharacterized protein n=1 Tax=Malus baccata TaxID=106549 RepID=A0A540N9L4_MALBA|nr:hypothetical protein C1H46_006674 [Malus baccata]
MHSPTKISDPCLTNLGGINSLLAMEHSSRVPSTVIWEWMPLTGLLVDQIFLLLLRRIITRSYFNSVPQIMFHLGQLWTQRLRIHGITTSTCVLKEEYSKLPPLKGKEDTQVGQFMKFEDLSETSSGKGSATSSESVQVPEFPKLHENVQGSMLFY